ncbi:MAG: PspC domain-containing protein [Rikenellaceae bacterium]|nr:PspC domain-containing protein [Rikenellaceae bacterium]
MENNTSNRRLMRTYPRVLAGVCAGVAEYFGLSTSLVRLVTALLLIFGGLSLWAYIILWIVIPSAPRRIVAHRDPKQLE